MTTSGYTAFKVSSFRPNSQIFIFSDQIHNLNTMNLLWGVQCFYYDKFTTTDETIQDCNDILKAIRTMCRPARSSSTPVPCRCTGNTGRIC